MAETMEQKGMELMQRRDVPEHIREAAYIMLGVFSRLVESEKEKQNASAFRAFRELTTFGLVERIPGGYAFIPDVAQTLRLHMPRLRNSPIREALVAAALGECV